MEVFLAVIRHVTVPIQNCIVAAWLLDCECLYHLCEVLSLFYLIYIEKNDLKVQQGVCPKLRVPPALGAHIFAAGCTFFGGVHPECPRFMSCLPLLHIRRVHG